MSKQPAQHARLLGGKVSERPFESLFEGPHSVRNLTPRAPDPDPDPEPQGPPPPTAEEIEVMCQEHREAGFADGVAQANAAIEAALAQSLDHVAGLANRMFEDFDSELMRIQREGAELALAIARRLAPALIAKSPLAEIEALVAHCLEGLAHEPRIVVRVATDLEGPLRPRLEEMASRFGITGRLVAIGDGDLQGSDCRIEWADGGAVRQIGPVIDEIDSIVRRWIDARGGEEGISHG